MFTATTTIRRLGAVLLAEHRQLEQLFDRIRCEAASNAGSDLRRTWRELERSLLAHMAWEERHLLPTFETFAPDDAATVRKDHENIRAQLARFGVDLELHLVREDMVQTFLTLLRAHAAREETTLYRWADEHLAPSQINALLAQLDGRAPNHASPPKS